MIGQPASGTTTPIGGATGTHRLNAHDADHPHDAANDAAAIEVVWNPSNAKSPSIRTGFLHASSHECALTR